MVGQTEFNDGYTKVLCGVLGGFWGEVVEIFSISALSHASQWHRHGNTQGSSVLSWGGGPK